MVITVLEIMEKQKGALLLVGNIQIANGVKIGAGAVVVKSFLTENATIVGIPAKEIDRK